MNIKDKIPKIKMICPQKHKAIILHASHASHLSYLALVFFHGPYDVAALVCLIIGGVTWVLHIE